MINRDYRHAKLTIRVGLAVAFWLGLVLVSPASGFQTGTNGAHGIAGDPATNGQYGTGGLEIDTEFDETVYVHGSRGGNGGNGGLGIDGKDEDQTARGGRSGAGGRGGNVTITITGSDLASPLYLSTSGGLGGTAGMFGRGTGTLNHGRGTGAGGGGNANIFVNDGADEMHVIANGGDGGNAYGLAGRAGHGGTTLVFSSATNRNPSSLFSITRLVRNGGDGGNGFLGSTGGNGASVIFESRIGNPGSIYSYGNTGTVRTRTSTLRGVAGNGGSSYNGLAGRAGNAVVAMPLLKTMLSAKYGSTTDSFITLHGGAGGKAIAGGNQHLSGADGGHANLTTAALLRSPNSNASFTIDLHGGRGGTAAGFYNQGDGGQGGIASLNATLSLDLIETSGNPLGNAQSMGRVSVSLTGGDGGHALGTGIAGDGADAEIVNMVSILSNGGSSIDFSATGGDGGWGRNTNGHGGNAIAETSNGISQTQPRIAPRGPTTATATAYGGHAGRGLAATNEANGGDATAMASDTQHFSSYTIAKAIGGHSNNGKSGDSFAQAQAISTGTDGPSDTNAFGAIAIAQAMKSGIELAFDKPRRGTNSTAQSLAVSQDGLPAIAKSRAIGGWGTVRSGWGLSTATAEHWGGGYADSLSTSSTIADRDPNSNNTSTSNAISRSHRGTALATSNAWSRGHFTENHATARVEALGGFAEATAKSSTDSWSHVANVRSTVFGRRGELMTTFDASSYFGFRQSTLASSTGYESHAHALLVPDQEFAESMLATSGLNDVFVDDAQADILGIGSFGGGAADNQLNTSLEVNLHFDATLEIRDFYDDKNMILGLFGADSTGGGFSSMDFLFKYNDESFIQETFLTLDEANSFFDDALFDMGAMGESGSLAKVEFNLAILIDNPMDSFNFNFVFGNADSRSSSFGNSTSMESSFAAVPEPTGGIVTAILALGLFHQRRRSKPNTTG